jgi:hypothetical protein
MKTMVKIVQLAVTKNGEMIETGSYFFHPVEILYDYEEGCLLEDSVAHDTNLRPILDKCEDNWGDNWNGFNVESAIPIVAYMKGVGIVYQKPLILETA